MMAAPGSVWWLALVVAPASVAFAAWRRRHLATAVTIADAVVWHDVPSTWRERWRRLPAVLRLAGLTVVAVAAGGPTGVATRATLVRVPADVLILIDASGSMRALDIAPSRLDAAITLANAIAAARPGDRIGVMAFGGRTTTLVPLTADPKAVETGLRDAMASLAALEDGTALGAAMVSGIDTLARRPSSGPRTIVVLTDGATNEGAVTPLDAARLAVSRGIVVHAIGIGRDGRVPYRSDAGLVHVTLPVIDDLLRRLAAGTGGRYWRVTSESGLADVAASFSRLDAPAPVREVRQVPVSRTRELLVLALLLFAVEAGLAVGPLRVGGR